MENDIYPVFFECQRFLGGQNRKKVEAHFRVRRKSGGGDCGPLKRVADNVYSIAFKNQKDQQEVLRRSEHPVDLTDGRQVFSVTGSLSPPNSSHDTPPTAPAESQQTIPTIPPSGKQLKEQLEERELLSLKNSPDPEDLLTSGCYSADYYGEEDATLERRLSQTKALGEVCNWKKEEDQQCKGTLDHYVKNLHEDVALQYQDEDNGAGKSVGGGSLVNTELLDQACLSESSGGFSLAESNRAVATYSLTDDLQLGVYLGDITTFEADALVNSSNEDLNHCKGIAAALSQAGGPEVQCGIDALKKHKGKVPIGEVLVTTGGELPCKRLLHAVCPVGGKANGEERMLLERTVQRTLNFAELLKLKSIAMPCLGLGMTGIPVTVCSDAIVSVFKEFCSRGGTSLKTIALIDDRGEIVRAMQEVCDRLLLGQSGAYFTESSDQLGSEFLFDSADQSVARGATAGAQKGLVQVEIVLGTIESQQTDAVVSPMVFFDPLSTHVGNIISKAIGPQVTEKIRRKSGEEMMPGDFILEEELTGVPFGAVFFCSLVPWDEDENGIAVQILRLGINKILTSCESKGFGSVALPVLGAGIALRFPVSLVSRVLQEQICRFELERTTKAPIRVSIVLHPGDEEASEVFKSVQEEMEYTKSTENDQKSDQDQASCPKRIVLLGKTGSGKSHLGNTILGEDVFTSYHTPNSGTTTCRSETRTVNGRLLTLIDTPGFFDTDRSEEELKPEIMRCLTECAPGPHVFLIVLKVDKFTKHEQEVISKICEHFSEDALNSAVIVFTHGGQLPEGMKIEKFVSQNKNLSDLVRKCGGRCHVFDNKNWIGEDQDDYRSNQFQLEAFLQTVDKMMVEKHGCYYTNDVLKHVVERIQNKEKQIRATVVHLPQQEIREQAKTIVSNEILIKLAGTATGALLGAFFGVAELLEFVFKLMKDPTVVRHVQNLKKLGPPEASEVAAVVIGVTAATLGGIRGGAIGLEASMEAKTVVEAIEQGYEAVKNKRDALKVLPQM